MALTEAEQKELAERKAADAAKKEYDNDLNRTDPDGVQRRMDEAVKKLNGRK